MSPEIQEWWHKSRSRINNLYLLTRPITSAILAKIAKHQLQNKAVEIVENATGDNA